MAKRTKTVKSTKSRARKKPSRRKKTSSDTGKPEPVVPARKRAMVLKKLRKLTSRPSKPTKHLGPVLNLSFDAPLNRPKQKTKGKPRKSKRKE
jgi:hypothetical protein